MCQSGGHPADNFKVKEPVPVGVIRLLGPLDLQTHAHTETRALADTSRCNHCTTSNIYLLAAIVLHPQEELFNKSCSAN